MAAPRSISVKLAGTHLRGVLLRFVGRLGETSLPVVKSRKQDRCCLDQEPRHHRVGNRDLVNIAPLQFGEEVVDLHCCVFGATTFWTSVSKRGSPRRGSRSGSTLIAPIFDPSRSAKLCS